MQLDLYHQVCLHGVNRHNSDLTFLAQCLQTYTDPYTAEPGYNDIGLCDISYITLDILWYQVLPDCYS